MIQRIQTLYLLLVVGLLVTAMCMPYGYFVDGLETSKFTPMGLTAGNDFHSSWGLFCLLLLSSIVAFATIFLFKNRILQIRMTIFNCILLVGHYIAFGVFWYTFKDALNMSFQINWALCLPLVAIILNYLAIRAIGKDEVIVKAADRIR